MSRTISAAAKKKAAAAASIASQQFQSWLFEPAYAGRWRGKVAGPAAAPCYDGQRARLLVQLKEI